MENVKISTSAENYLEAILLLERKNRVARVKDIANLVEVKMPSVSGALKALKQQGLINYSKNSYISLTDEGLRLATIIDKDHQLIAKFLHEVLMIPFERATREACAIEHVIGPETSQRLERLIDYIFENFIDKGPETIKKWKTIIGLEDK